jgi:hypothetical protein
MKSIDFVKRVLQEAKVDLTKLGLTEITADTDLPEEAVTSYANNLLTRERVEADPDINKTMQARAFKALNDGWDKDFHAYAEANLPKEVADKVKSEQFTRNKWDLIRKHVHSGTGDGDAKVKAAQAEIAKLHDELKAKDDAINLTKNDYEGKLGQFQKNYLLTQKLSGKEWAEAYADLKPDLQEKFLKTISEKSIILELSNGQLTPKRKAEDGSLLDYYEANVKVGLDDLITKELGKYFKQSAGTGSQGSPSPKPIPGTTPKEGLTLAEMERVKVLEKFAKLKTQ